MKKKSLLLLVPIVVALTGCSQEVSLKGSESALAEKSVTQTAEAIIFPDDNPSIPDGAVTWQKMSCAECHSDTGKGVPGKCEFDLTSLDWARKQKPLDQYAFLTYGKSGSPHPALKDKLSRREIWNLVFYTRNLAVPALTDEEFAQIDPVFGGNCAVCHGKQGHGDGPLAKPIPGQAIIPFEPLPANFHQFNRFYDRTDEVLWDHIANGIKWEGMPNFLGKEDRAKGVKFDEEYIRNLVRYVRNFHSSNKATLATAASDSASSSQSK